MTTATRPGLRDHARELLLTLVFDTVIGVFFFLALGGSLGRAILISQCIGLSIMGVSWVVRWLGGPGTSRRRIALVAIPVGAAIGVGLSALVTGGALARDLGDHPRVLGSMLGGALVFGTVVSWYFYSVARLAEGEVRLRQELLERARSEQRLTEANLKLLQAQIEPHFLFNTLSTVIHLVDEQPAEARRMLENLTAYLRASLQRTRSGRTTLGEELDLVRAYLEIQAVRLGPRLRYGVEAPPELCGLDLPPLLVQPLVENAVRHGLEPKPGGGAVEVRASRDGDTLVLEVKDTGLGMAVGRPPGVGLSNVRSRVQEVYRGRGELVLRPNQPEGLCARLTVPVARLEGSA